MTIKMDPGSKQTGFALVDKDSRVLFAAELEHRGKAIKAALDSRRYGGNQGRKSLAGRYPSVGSFNDISKQIMAFR